MAFSEKLKAARLKANLTQQALADVTEIPKRTIENWECGLREPPPYIQKLVLEKLDTMST